MDLLLLYMHTGLSTTMFNPRRCVHSPVLGGLRSILRVELIGPKSPMMFLRPQVGDLVNFLWRQAERQSSQVFSHPRFLAARRDRHGTTVYGPP